MSFAEDIAPIFKGWCVSCHQPGGEGYNASGLDLTSYDGVMKETKFGPMVISRSPPCSASRVRARRHRAVPADRPAGAPMRLTRSSRRCGCWPTSRAGFLFRGVLFRDHGWGRTMELGRSAAMVRWRTMPRSTAPCRCWPGRGRRGGERRELRGHQQSAAKFSSTVTATLASLAPRCGSERSAEFARVHHLVLLHACARGAIERCRPTDPPVRRCD